MTGLVLSNNTSLLWVFVGYISQTKLLAKNLIFTKEMFFGQALFVTYNAKTDQKTK